jgi:hypothetical protein
MKKFPLFGIIIAILFITLGIYLISKEDQLSNIVGYANIIFFSGVLLFTFVKLLSNRNK